METIKKKTCKYDGTDVHSTCESCSATKEVDTGVYSWEDMRKDQGLATIDSTKTFFRNNFGIAGTPKGIHKVTYDALMGKKKEEQFVKIPGVNYGLKLVKKDSQVNLVDSLGYTLLELREGEPMKLFGYVESPVFPVGDSGQLQVKDIDGNLMVSEFDPVVKFPGKDYGLYLEKTSQGIQLRDTNKFYLLTLTPDKPIQLHGSLPSDILPVDSKGFLKVAQEDRLELTDGPKVATMQMNDGSTLELVARYNQGLKGIELTNPVAGDCILWIRPDGGVHLNNPSVPEQKFYKGMQVDDNRFFKVFGPTVDANYERLKKQVKKLLEARDTQLSIMGELKKVV